MREIVETRVLSASCTNLLNKDIKLLEDDGYEPLEEAKLYFNNSSKVFVITMVKYKETKQ